MVQLLYVKLRVYNDCEVLKLLTEKYIIRILDIRSINKDTVKHLVVMPIEYLRKCSTRYPYIRFKLLKVSGKTCTVSIEKRPCTVCKAIIDNCAFMISGVAKKASGVLYTFLIEQNAFNELLKIFRKKSIRYGIVEASKIRFRSDILTETQELILFTALEAGFFDYPRKITLKKLAESFNISPSTVDEIIRRALKKILREYFKKSQKFSGYS